MRVLLMEDDPHLCTAYARCLRGEGFAVDEVHNLGSARAQVDDVDYDCLVLDRRVPGGDGLDLASELQSQGGTTPVLIMSAMSDPSERVAGLRRGADDYLAKPVDLDELSLRVRKLVVRRGSPEGATVRIGVVAIDRALRSVTIAGRSVHLTPTQFGVLDHLLANQHRLVSTNELLEHVWDRNTDLMSAAVHSQISRLRRVFDSHLTFDRIRDGGYVLRPADDDHRSAGDR